MDQARDNSDMRATELHPKKWWQWLLLYPALALGVVSAVPTWVEAGRSYSLGLKYGTSGDAMEQNRLWQTNFACSQQADFQNQKTKWGVEIGSFVCDSGDVLLRGKRPEEPEHLRWIAWNRVAPEQRSNVNISAVLFPAVHASERRSNTIQQTPPTAVVCQRWIEAGQLLQRVRNGNACYDQRVNTFSGLVSDRRPAPCTATC